MDHEIERHIRQMVARVCAIDGSGIEAERPLVEYGLDSARAMDLLLLLEDKFEIAIPDKDAARMSTLSLVVSYVRSRQTG